MRNNEKQNDAIMKVGHPHLMIIKRTIHFTGKEKKRICIYNSENNTYSTGKKKKNAYTQV